MATVSVHPNMVNEAMNLKAIETPQVGMVATMFCGSDRWPMVCTEVLAKNKVRAELMADSDYTFVSANNSKYLPGDRLFTRNYFRELDDSSSYVTINGKAVKRLEPRGKIYTLRKNHRWMEVGHDMWSVGGVNFGHADEYRDPDF